MTEENPYLASQTTPGAGSEEYLDQSHSAPQTEEEFEEDESDGVPESYDYAGFVTRALAKIIDTIVFNLAFLFIFGLFSGVKALVFPTDPLEGSEYQDSFGFDEYEYPSDSEAGSEQWARIEARRKSESPGGLSETMLTGIGIASFMVFAGLSEWLSGQSLGKLILGIQVVDLGPPALPSIGMAIGRNVGLIVDCMLLGLFAFFVMRTNPRNQRAGDLAASTLVVRKSSIPGSPLSTATEFMHGMLASLLSLVVISIALLMIDPTL